MERGRRHEWTGTSTTFKPGVPLPCDPSSSSSVVARRMAEYNSPLNGQSGGALLPPIDALDPLNTKECVDELRRKRLQSKREMLCGPNAEESLLLRRKKGNNDESAGHSSSLRSTRNHRLSAPSFPDNYNIDVRETARALKERMDKNEDGDLSTINEGLITPVVRRKIPLKEVMSPQLPSEISLPYNRSSQSRIRSSRVVAPLCSECPLSVSPSPLPLAPSPLPPNSLQPVFPPISSSTPLQWSAVTNELKTRQQKVAKVLPTPQTPRVSLEQRMTIKEGIMERRSDYAQISECTEGTIGNVTREDDSLSVAGTVFDEPWDSNTWESLLVCAGEGRGRVSVPDSVVEEEEMERFPEEVSPSVRVPSRHSLLSMDPSGSLRRPAKIDSASNSIEEYIMYLSVAGGTFSKSLSRFIECVKESQEKNARLVAKNVRQFMNGMKNYLMKHGEGDLHSLITRESSRLSRHTVLNMDTILEDSLNRLILKPLCDHIYHTMRSSQRVSGSLVSLFSNVEKAKQMSPVQLGLSDKSISPSPEAIDKLRLLAKKMQSDYSPHRKLEMLLKASQLIFSIQTASEGRMEGRSVTPPAHDLVLWFVWFISRTLSVACELEALYMNELLPTQLRQSGEGALYLTAFDSAIRILSSPGGVAKLNRENVDIGKGTDSKDDCLVRVAVPDELAGCVHYESFPLLDDTTVSRLCRLVAHQHAITNAEDYGLYVLSEGFESLLPPSDLIEPLRHSLSPRPFLFVYKRHEARLAWPAFSSLHS